MNTGPRLCVPTCGNLRGFTLLEVLVVLVIIGIVVSFATLSFKGSDQRAEEEAQRVQALLGLASQEAILQSREIAVEFTSRGYAFLAFDGTEWKPLEGDEILRDRKLPEDITLNLESEGGQAKLGEKEGEKSTARIYLLSSGESSPFRLTVQKQGATGGYVLSGGMRGQLDLTGAGNEK